MAAIPKGAEAHHDDEENLQGGASTSGRGDRRGGRGWG